MMNGNSLGSDNSTPKKPASAGFLMSGIEVGLSNFNRDSAFGPLGYADWGRAGWYTFSLFKNRENVGEIKIYDPYKDKTAEATCTINIFGQQKEISLGAPSKEHWLYKRDFRQDYFDKIGEAIDEMVETENE